MYDLPGGKIRADGSAERGLPRFNPGRRGKFRATTLRPVIRFGTMHARIWDHGANHRVQFRLKTLMIAVTCIALAAAAIAPWFRTLDELTQLRLVLIFGGLGLVNAASFGLFKALERTECRRAGDCWKVVRLNALWPRWQIVLSSVPPIIFVFLLVHHITNAASDGGGINQILFFGGPAIMILSYWLPSLAMHFRMTRVQLHERGLIYGRIIPRTSIQGWSWSHDRLVLELSKSRRRQIPIPTEDRDEVEKILQRWSEANSRSSEPIAGTTPLMLFALPLIFLVPMLVIAMWMFTSPPPPPPMRAPRVRAPAVVAPATANPPIVSTLDESTPAEPATTPPLTPPARTAPR